MRAILEEDLKSEKVALHATFIDRPHVAVVRRSRTPQANAPATNLSDELQKLSKLKEQGVLSEEDFQAAKMKVDWMTYRNSPNNSMHRFIGVPKLAGCRYNS